MPVSLHAIRPGAGAIKFPLAVLFLMFLSIPCFAKTIYVSPEGDAIHGDGESWESAFTDVSSAVDIAVSEDEIWIASGFYQEQIVMKEGIHIIGGFLGVDAEVAGETIIQGTSAPFFTAIWNSSEFEGLSSAQEASFIERPTIIGATNSIVERITVSGGVSPQGGGIYCENSDMAILDCRITRNLAAGDYGLGGGIYCSSSTIHLIGTKVDTNIARGTNPWGGSYSYGGGVFGSNSVFIMENCTVSDNIVVYGNSDFGAGLAALENSKVYVANCLFHGNQRRITGSGSGDGVAIHLRESEIRLKSSTIADNHGGAIGGISLDLSTGTFEDVILRNQFGEITSGTVTYSLVEGGYPGQGNIDADPLFVNPDLNDYRLLPGSPCIDSATVVDLVDDLDGSLRPVDIEGIGAMGETAFDMGAYEAQSGPTSTWTATMTPTASETSFVTHTPTPSLTSTLAMEEELFSLLGQWHEETDDKLVEDHDNDGFVGPKDLILLLRSWLDD